MTRIEPEFNPRRSPSLVAWAVCGLALAAGLAMQAVAWRDGALAEHLRTPLAAAQATAQEAARSSAETAAVPPPPYADSAHELLAERSLQWQTTLLALERTAMEGVTPVSVDVLARERSARVEVQFTDYAVLLQYLERLNAGGTAPEQWALVSAQRAEQAAVPATAVLTRRW